MFVYLLVFARVTLDGQVYCFKTNNYFLCLTLYKTHISTQFCCYEIDFSNIKVKVFGFDCDK